MIPSENRTAVFAIVIAAFAATLGIGTLVPAIPALTAGLPAVAHGALLSAFAFARIGTAMTFTGFLARITVSWVVVPAVATTMLSLSPQHYGLIIGVGTAVNLLFLPVNARLIDSWSASRTVLAASAPTLMGVVLMWLAPVQWALWVGTAFVMIVTSALVTAAATVALEGIPPEQTGAVTGTNRAAGDIGTALGPILASGATVLLGLTASPPPYWRSVLPPSPCCVFASGSPAAPATIKASRSGG
ncbi:hypothetical protein MWN33_06055 [Starkeya koreensis]|uniref:Major Facilitator Superfamily protein n=1 Tax=Ancylobacter koreensis TaxID=266121 RepID=A0ABT0DJY1_9HYPH|nr:MFS transporter [Ancylobacter koreensis]MCK0207593.1 hypothetical protein [Ancylobacter koreensis]